MLYIFTEWTHTYVRPYEKEITAQKPLSCLLPAPPQG